MLDLRIENARLLKAEGEVNGSLAVEDGCLRLDVGGVEARQTVDAGGRLVAPGIIDLHGDAFERQIMPRPGVDFPIDLALLETDRQMLANGITTAFHGISYSWEPGLRGRENCVALLEALAAIGPRLGCDTHAHLRWETFNLEGGSDVKAWLAEGLLGVLAFNNHARSIARTIKAGTKAAKYIEQTGLSGDALDAFVDEVLLRADDVKPAVERLAGAALNAGIAMMSHDDPDAATRQHYRAVGCTIAEFPITREAAADARQAGEAVIFGAPNVVLGGSHTNAVTVSEMVAEGLCDVLATDYYYPAPLHAAFRLADDGVLPLHEAWRLISTNAADAVGMSDRGRIEEGQRADLVLVDDGCARNPSVLATWVAGRMVSSGPGLQL